MFYPILHFPSSILSFESLKALLSTLSLNIARNRCVTLFPTHSLLSTLASPCTADTHLGREALQQDDLSNFCLPCANLKAQQSSSWLCGLLTDKSRSFIQASLKKESVLGVLKCPTFSDNGRSIRHPLCVGWGCGFCPFSPLVWSCSLRQVLFIPPCSALHSGLSLLNHLPTNLENTVSAL